MTARTPAQRKADERARMRDLGMILRQVWIHPDNWPHLRRIITDAAADHIPNEPPSAAVISRSPKSP